MTKINAIEQHLENALKLADDGMSRLDPEVLRNWAGDVAAEDIPVFTAWLERARDAGRMQRVSSASGHPEQARLKSMCLRFSSGRC